MKTIRDIAKIAGVGVSTVSRAINNHPDINQETKDKIMEVIRENNYIPNNSARNLKRLNSDTIAVLIKGITNPFFSKMIGVFEEETKKKDYSFILQRVRENENELEIAIELVKEKRLKGIIFLGGSLACSKEQVSQLDVPFVLSTSGATSEYAQLEAENWAAVSVDDYAESYKMTDYYCSSGHKRIALIAACKNDCGIGKQRLEGYKAALKDHGIEFDESLVVYMDGDRDEYSIETGYRLMKQLMKQVKDFTAVFAIADSLAIGALRALFEAGKKIPEEISVSGFDGIDMGAYYTPSLTTIRQPVEELAETTVRLLFELIDQGGQYRKEILPGELLIRESTMARSEDDITAGQGD